MCPYRSASLYISFPVTVAGVDEKKIFDIFASVDYNILNKGAESQRTPGARQSFMYRKIAPYFTRVGALFFAFVIGYKGNNCTQHNDKCEYI